MSDDLVLAVLPYTMTGPLRIQAMIAAISHIEEHKIAGDIVECGVWRAGNIILARKLAPYRLCWLYDTFAGMTLPGDEDMKGNGTPAMERYVRLQTAGLAWCAASLESVIECFKVTGTFDEDKLRFVVGDVRATLLAADNLPKQIALLRLDTDFYESTAIELAVLYPLLMPGGVLVVDDYGHWLGAKKAVDEYFDGQDVEFTKIDYTAVSLVKPEPKSPETG